MPFKSELILKPAVEDDEWILVNALIYQTREGITHEAPIGLITDLASIPRMVQPLIPVNGLHRKPAVIHDLLYTMQISTRDYADSILLEAMEDIGVSWWKRKAMYAAVRVGGWLTWDTRAKEMRRDPEAYMRRNGL